MATCPQDAARPRGRPRSADKDEAIVSAATRLFMDRGFEAVTMDAIAEAAGVAKVTIYARFPDKEALFRAVLRAKCEAITGPDLLDSGGSRSVVEALSALASNFLALVLSPDAMNMHRLLMAEGMRAPRVSELFYEAAVGRLSDQLGRYFREVSAAGRLSVPVGGEQKLAWRFLGAVKGEPHMRAMMGLPPLDPVEIRAHVRACAEDLVRAYAPHTGGGARA